LAGLRQTLDAKRPIQIFISAAGPGNGPPNLYGGFHELACRMMFVHRDLLLLLNN